MEVLSYAFWGFEGFTVSIDVDVRRGIPGLDIVGLPDGAVREARERIRIAIKRSGFEFPQDRILVNLAPAGLKKEGAHFDLPLAVAILEKTGQLPDLPWDHLLLMGELHLNGEIRGVRGVLPALIGAKAAGKERFIIPEANLPETITLGHPGIRSLGHLNQLPEILVHDPVVLPKPEGESQKEPVENLSDMIGQSSVRRALEIAAAGRHNLLLFGPPGSGKTMAARRLPGILPSLDDQGILDVTRIWSLAGKLEPCQGLIRRPVLRSPHHSASLEGLIGGGSRLEPGEVSLAHKGILFLDETPEFGSSILQSLREPMENGIVNLSRAGNRFWFPADFQLVMAANPCPCGNLGREEGFCVCSPVEIYRYWKRLGGALLDRIDLRIPVLPVGTNELLSATKGESSLSARKRVTAAVALQENRYARCSWDRNSRLPPGALNEFCCLGTAERETLVRLVGHLKLSTRAAHSLIKTSRTIADLAGRERIGEEDLLEAGQLRRYGDRDVFWHRLD